MHIVQIHQHLNQDVVKALEAVLDAARRGQVVGLAGVVLMPGGGWDTLIRGQAKRDPLSALGGAVNLKYELIELSSGQPPPLNRGF